MRRLAILALVVALPLSAQQQQGATRPDSGNATAVVAQAQLDGQLAATNVGTGGWFGSGLVTGVFTGLIGTGVVWAVAGSSNVELPPERKVTMANRDETYRTFYEKAYADKVKSSRKSSALKGGLLGTAAFVLLLVSAGGVSQ